MRRPISMAGAELVEFHNFAELEKAWLAQGAPRLLLITPISASKRHIPYDEFQRALKTGAQRTAFANVLWQLHEVNLRQRGQRLCRAVVHDDDRTKFLRICHDSRDGRGMGSQPVGAQHAGWDRRSALGRSA